MNADARGVLVEQSGDDIQSGPKDSERLEALAQLHVGARALRPPVVGTDAVAHEQGRKPLRMSRRGRARSRFTACDGDRLQPGKTHRHADAGQERTTAELV